MKFLKISCCIILSLAVLPVSAQTNIKQRSIWTAEQANAWYKQQPWLVGANFLPSSAINELEMWQAETFDTATIAKEFGWAASLGMNTMRIFLHDLAYQQDPAGFKKRIKIVLSIASRYNIRPLFVLFDSCWDPFPHPGKQHQPAPFLHNSGWVQSPGADVLKDSTQLPRLQKYVTDIVNTFRDDKRVLAWDVWNEPDNINNGSYGRFEPYEKVDLVYNILAKVFQWARSSDPTQPLTSGVWHGNWSHPDSLTKIDKLMINQSDIISFHNYDTTAEFNKRVQWLLAFNKPIICTEYMARVNGSTFQSTMPTAKKYKIAVFNWGFVNGKSQTIYPWDSWGKVYTSEPPVWFHDVFRKDGTPYRQAEVDFIRDMTGNKGTK